MTSTRSGKRPKPGQRLSFKSILLQLEERGPLTGWARFKFWLASILLKVATSLLTSEPDLLFSLMADEMNQLERCTHTREAKRLEKFRNNSISSQCRGLNETLESIGGTTSQQNIFSMVNESNASRTNLLKGTSVSSTSLKGSPQTSTVGSRKGSRNKLSNNKFHLGFFKNDGLSSRLSDIKEIRNYRVVMGC